MPRDLEIKRQPSNRMGEGGIYPLPWAFAVLKYFQNI